MSEDLKLNYHIGKRSQSSKSCEVIKLIRTRLLRKGKGTADDPMRIITQYWTLEGLLLWEVDALEEMRAHQEPPNDHPPQ